MNPLTQLYHYGQSFWYDNMRRLLLLDGTFQRLIEQDGLRGCTSNPAIFQKAIGESDDYTAQIDQLRELETKRLYETLAVADIQLACDLFAPLYAQSNKLDGYVSLEVSPYLAHQTGGTVEEAVRLWEWVARPNLMIKVPATPAGYIAIETLIGRGINVNVTLMFNSAHYEAVAQAYLRGLQNWHNNGGDLSHVASVASFFVSRLDSAVDPLVAHHPHLQGKTAIANCKLVYQRYLEIFHAEPFAALQAAGARPQRLLWASTSTKNPTYPDTLYVDQLIGRETVNTMPPSTVTAFRDHGRLAETLTADLHLSQQHIAELAELEVDLDLITEQLQSEGVEAFKQSFDTLLNAIAMQQGWVR